MTSKKGQAAIEYMMTYGWAILLILMTGVILWQMGIFNPPSPPPGCRGFSQVTVLDHSAALEGGRIYIVIANEAGTKLTISQNDIKLRIANADCVGTGAPNFDVDNFRPGQSIKVNASCTFQGRYNKGDYYKAHINITYTNAQSGLSHKSAGECWGSVE